jgi:benzoate 4-monooxygenase
MTTFLDTLPAMAMNFIILLIFIPIILLMYHILAYVIDPQAIRAIPGPFLAKFTDAWFGWVSAHGHRSEVVHEMHKKYGSFTYRTPA